MTNYILLTINVRPFTIYISFFCDGLSANICSSQFDICRLLGNSIQLLSTFVLHETVPIGNLAPTVFARQLFVQSYNPIFENRVRLLNYVLFIVVKSLSFGVWTRLPCFKFSVHRPHRLVLDGVLFYPSPLSTTP